MPRFAHRLRYRDPSGSGFTLVELVLVVAVIGILAAVSYSLMQDVILRARISQAQAMAATIRSAVKIQNSSMLISGRLNGSCNAPFPMANDINANVNSQNGGGEIFNGLNILQNGAPFFLNRVSNTTGIQSMMVCGPVAPACSDLLTPNPVHGSTVGYYYNESTGEVWPATPNCSIFDPTSLSQ